MTKPAPETPIAPKAAAKKKAPARPRAKSGRKAAALPIPVRLADADVANARANARAWDRTVRFAVSDFFVHAKFGVGYVTGFTEQDFMVCLFEDGGTRKLIHAQS